jgi:hypothetical protein
VFRLRLSFFRPIVCLPLGSWLQAAKEDGCTEDELEALEFAEDNARSTAAEAAGDRRGAVRAWGTQPLTEAGVEMLGQRWRR